MRRLRCSSQLAWFRRALAMATSASRCMASACPDPAPARWYSATAELSSWNRLGYAANAIQVLPLRLR